MIALLHGVIAARSADRVIVLVAGVGYEVLVPVATLVALPQVGGEARLFTRMQVRDDQMVLYGFASADERAVFDLLVKVSGVGPKYALAVLSTLAPDAFRRAVMAGDADALTVVPGIGKKVAARIVLDLKDQVGAGETEVLAGPLSEVREALLALGLTPEEARDAVSSLSGAQERPVEELLREALQGVHRA